MATGQAATEPPRMIEGRYVVQLRPLRQDETVDTYVRHIESVNNLCTGQRTQDGRPARIVDVLQYPEDSPKPTFFCYIGDFNDTISQSIQRTTDVWIFLPSNYCCIRNVRADHIDFEFRGRFCSATQYRPGPDSFGL